MKAIRLAWWELARFRGRTRWLIPFALTLVPLLCGALYLWSTWDPYGSLKRVPVAVVNADRPVSLAGQRIEAGAQFVRQLRAAGPFGWRFVDAATATRGLEQGRYYATITVPPDFSATLAAAAHVEPRRATLKLTKNDANGYLSGILVDSAKARLQNQINAAARAVYAHAIYGELDKVRGKLEQASEASKQLVRGTDLGRDGSSALTKGVDGVREGADEVTRGARQVSDASAELDRQIASVAEVTGERLPATVDALVQASNVAVNSLSAIKTATGFLADRADDTVATLGTLAERHPGVGQDPTFHQALDNARQLAGAAKNADAEAQQALDTAHSANTQAAALQRDLAPLREQVLAISKPAATLEAGAAQLAGGTDGLTSGLHTLASSSDVLRSGADQLNNGAKNLDGLVNDSLDRIPPTDPAEVARAADVLGTPTRLDTANLNPANVYGRGLAPLLFSIAFWIFGLAAYTQLRPLNARALTGGSGPTTLTLAGWFPAALLGVAGAMLLLAVTTYGLGLDPEDVWATAGMVALGAGAFVAVHQFLRAVLGHGAIPLSLLLLIVQLVACGGLYPLETAPLPVSAASPFLPMTYLVDGLRVTISGGPSERLIRDAVVLGGVFAFFLVLTAVTAIRQRTWTVRRLHPLIEW